MNGESSFELLTRSYENVLRKEAYDKKIKLTDSSKKNIMSRAMEKLYELHDKKIEYKDRINQLNKVIAETKEKLANREISTLEKEQLKFYLKEAELERDKQVVLLPRNLEKIKKNIDKTIVKARKDLAKAESKRPIKVSDVSIRTYEKLMARFEAIHHFFRNGFDISVAPDVVEAAQLNVKDIDVNAVEGDVNEAIAEAESQYQQTSESSDANIDGVVSDFVDNMLSGDASEEEPQEEIVIERVEDDKNDYLSIPVEDLAYVGDDSQRYTVQIPEDRNAENQELRIIDTPVEEPVPVVSQENSMQECASKLEKLQQEFTEAVKNVDVDKCKEIQEKIQNIVSTIDKIGESNENDLDIAKQNENKVEKEEEELKLEIINGLSSNVKSLVSYGNDGIERASSLQQQTSAIVERTRKIRASIDDLRSYSSSMKAEQTRASELNSMFQEASGSKESQVSVSRRR